MRASPCARSSRPSTTMASAATTAGPMFRRREGRDRRRARQRGAAGLAWRLLPTAAQPQHLSRCAARDGRAPGFGRVARWLASDQVRDGEIVPPGPNAGVGALGLEKHAFVIVGYTPRGFLVLNSWGRDWGGWRPEASGRTRCPNPYPGSRCGATRTGPTPSWTAGCYAWASAQLRLSSFPSATRALASASKARCARRRCTRSSAIFFLDDGRYVGQGAYISTRRTLSETKRLLVEDAGSRSPSTRARS